MKYKHVIKRWRRKATLSIRNFYKFFLTLIEGKKMLLSLLPALVSLVILKTFKVHIGVLVFLLFLLFIGILLYKDPDLDRKLLKTKFIENLVFIGIRIESIFWNYISFQISVSILLGLLVFSYQSVGFIVLTLLQIFVGLYQTLRRDAFSTEKFDINETKVFVKVSRETLVDTFFTITGREVSTKYKTGPGATLFNRYRSMKAGKKTVAETKERVPAGVLLGIITVAYTTTFTIVDNRLKLVNANLSETNKAFRDTAFELNREFGASLDATPLEDASGREKLEADWQQINHNLNDAKRDFLSKNSSTIGKVFYGARDIELADKAIDQARLDMHESFPKLQQIPNPIKQMDVGEAPPFMSKEKEQQLINSLSKTTKSNNAVDIDASNENRKLREKLVKEFTNERDKKVSSGGVDVDLSRDLKKESDKLIKKFTDGSDPKVSFGEYGFNDDYGIIKVFIKFIKFIIRYFFP